MDTLAQQAIQAAMNGDWHTAERLNRRLISSSPSDIESLLRLANAVSQLGKLKEATTLYEKILKIDPHNVFATRGLSRCKSMGSLTPKTLTSQHHTLSNSFLEEPGKTRTAALIHPAYTESLARLDTGERVMLSPRRRRISVVTESGTYIGRLPDDLSMRLLGFIKGGNDYEVIVKSISGDQVKVFIREIYKSPKFSLTPSFPTDTITSSAGSEE